MDGDVYWKDTPDIVIRKICLYLNDVCKIMKFRTINRHFYTSIGVPIEFIEIVTNFYAEHSLEPLYGPNKFLRILFQQNKTDIISHGCLLWYCNVVGISKKALTDNPIPLWHVLFLENRYGLHDEVTIYMDRMDFSKEIVFKRYKSIILSDVGLFMLHLVQIGDYDAADELWEKLRISEEDFNYLYKNCIGEEIIYCEESVMWLLTKYPDIIYKIAVYYPYESNKGMNIINYWRICLKPTWKFKILASTFESYVWPHKVHRYFNNEEADDVAYIRFMKKCISYDPYDTYGYDYLFNVQSEGNLEYLTCRWEKIYSKREIGIYMKKIIKSPEHFVGFIDYILENELDIQKFKLCIEVFEELILCIPVMKTKRTSDYIFNSLTFDLDKKLFLGILMSGDNDFLLEYFITEQCNNTVPICGYYNDWHINERRVKFFKNMGNSMYGIIRIFGLLMNDFSVSMFKNLVMVSDIYGERFNEKVSQEICDKYVCRDYWLFEDDLDFLKFVFTRLKNIDLSLIVKNILISFDTKHRRDNSVYKFQFSQFVKTILFCRLPMNVISFNYLEDLPIQVIKKLMQCIHQYFGKESVNYLKECVDCFEAQGKCDLQKYLTRLEEQQHK